MLDATPPTPELSAIAKINSAVSPLLRLPAEVRNSISHTPMVVYMFICNQQWLIQCARGW
ncbi:hypothetical protein G6011_07503 [Alternaria panax]|uniref:Uncharacterized protein n=1 Tax=Alternaria panax TaxID=48097 RepID=A0AAD4FF24_9PLEO|nr:hypothetical protein G6011_07503 [Alternaria panax]